jgi:Sortase domain
MEVGRTRRRIAGAGMLGPAVVLALALVLGGCVPLPPALAGQPSAGGAGKSSGPRAGRPVHLSIPAIGLDWPVVPVGRDATGAMDTPQGPESAPSWHEGFWYKYGYLAGQPGNAVIAGHVDDVAGNLTDFARISQLQPGDAIEVRTDQGDTLRFTVMRMESVPNPVGGPNDPTIGAIFGPSATPNLNLITCTGTWVGNEFDQRLVVHATLDVGAGNTPGA